MLLQDAQQQPKLKPVYLTIEPNLVEDYTSRKQRDTMTNIMTLTVKSDGVTWSINNVTSGMDDMYEFLSNSVEGLIERVTIPFPKTVVEDENIRIVMYVNEEGMIKDLPVNSTATAIARTAFKWLDPRLNTQDFHGNAVFVAEYVDPKVTEDDKGFTTHLYANLPQRVIDSITSTIHFTELLLSGDIQIESPESITQLWKDSSASKAWERN